MANDPRLNVQITAQMSAFQAELRRATAAVRQSSVSMTTDLTKTKSALGGVDQAVTALGRTFGVSLGAAAVVGFARHTVDIVGGLKELADQLGITTEQVQVYGFAAVQNGAKQEQMEKAVARLTALIGEAADGNGEAVQKFEQLKIGVLDASNEVRKTGPVFEELAKSIAAAGTEAERGRIAREFLGREGQRLIPFLLELADGYDQMARKAKGANAVIGDDTIERFDKLSDSISRAGKQLTVFAADHIDVYLKAVTEAHQAIQPWIGDLKWLQGFDFGPMWPVDAGKRIGQQLATNPVIDFVLGRPARTVQQWTGTGPAPQITDTIPPVKPPIPGIPVVDGSGNHNPPTTQDIALQKYIRGLDEAARTEGLIGTEKATQLALTSAQNMLLDQRGKRLRDLKESERAQIASAIERKGISTTSVATEQILRTAEANTKLAEAAGISVAAEREQEVQNKALQFQYANFGKTLGTDAQKAIADYTDALREQQRQEMAVTAAQTNRDLGNQITDRKGLIDAIRQSATAEQEYAIAIQARVYAEKIGKDVTDDQVKSFVEKQRALAQLSNQETNARNVRQGQSRLDLLNQSMSLSPFMAPEDRAGKIAELEKEAEIRERNYGLTEDQIAAEVKLAGELARTESLNQQYLELAGDASKVISTYFEEALGSIGKTHDALGLLKAALMDLSKIGTRMFVTKPLENAMTGIMGQASKAGAGDSYMKWMMGSSGSGASSGGGGGSGFGGFISSLLGSSGGEGGMGGESSTPYMDSMAADGAFSMYHQGGIVGRDGQPRYVHPAVFADAPRLHGGGMASPVPGLKPREVPAILMDDEEVLTSGNPRHRKNFKGGGGTTVNQTWNVTTKDARGFEESRGMMNAQASRGMAMARRDR